MDMTHDQFNSYYPWYIITAFMWMYATMTYETQLAKRGLQVFEVCDSTFVCNWKAQQNAQTWTFSDFASANVSNLLA
jgi:hypothetical protein